MMKFSSCNWLFLLVKKISVKAFFAQKMELMNFFFKSNIKVGGDIKMSNPKKDSKHFRPSHLGTQPRTGGGNNGKQMRDTSGKHAQVIQTKGE